MWTKIWYKWNKQIHIENRLVIGKGDGVGGGMNEEFQLSRCKLLYVEWLDNKVLLYIAQGTRVNILQQTIMNEYEKMHIYVCV